MKLHEYQAKDIFGRYNIPVPKGKVASTQDEASKIADSLGGSVVLKSQVHAGGRGKAGGIKVSTTPEQVQMNAEILLGKRLVTHQTGPDGVPVNKILVEQMTGISKELYIAVVVDKTFEGPVLIASESGGMEIEEIAETEPSKIHKEPIDPVIGLQLFQCRRLAYALNLDPTLIGITARIAMGLYTIFMEYDCSLVEINPLGVTTDNQICALDGKIVLDDDGIFRHPDLRALRDIEQEDPLEAQAQDYEISYVKLDGNVGCLVNGAGLAMATMDVIKGSGAAPANFLDVGGSADVEKISKAFGLMLSDPNVTSALINVFGGILRCDVVAKGVVKACLEKNPGITILARMSGTNMEEGKNILGTSGLNVTFANTLADVSQNMNILSD